MSVISYNGVTLQILRVNCRREAIFLGPTYLFTRWVIATRAVYNPGATDYALPGGNAPPVPSGTSFAPQTDSAIRHKLMQARASLTWTVGGVLVLQSPNVSGTADITDANNGPLPLYVNVNEVMGTKTFMVDFAIQTDVNESSLFTSQAPRLLAHQFSMTHDIDENYFTVRTIQGQAVLRSDLLTRAAITSPGSLPRAGMQGNLPDQFRAWLFQPVPQGFKRDHIQVKSSLDGNTLEYTVVDRELAWNYGGSANAAGVTRIEAVHTAGSSRFPSQQMVIEGRGLATERIGGLVGGVLGSLGSADSFGLLNTFFQTGLATNMDVQRFGLQSTPRATSQLDIRVWGNKLSNFTNLANVAYTVLSARTDQLNTNIEQQSGYKPGRQNSLSYHYHPSYKLVHLVSQIDYVGANGQAVLNSGVTTTDLRALMPDQDDVPNVLTSAPVQANPAPPGPQGAWGTYAEHLVSQILMSQDSTPPQQSSNPTPPVKPLNP